MTAMRKTALIVCGTRPEIIKLAPVYKALSAHGGPVVPLLCATGQHTDMADHTFEVFGLRPDLRIHPGAGPMSLVALQSRLMFAIEPIFQKVNPDLVIVQGDTVSALAGAQAAFSTRVPVAHVEAGLRSFDLHNPFPEEGCRAMIAQVASLHFAPTRRSADNLLQSGIPAGRVLVTGNTVTDAALDISRRRPEWPSALPPVPDGMKLVLVTTHRRESWGRDLAEICRAISTLHDRRTDVVFLLPVHLNPNVRGPVTEILSGRERIHLADPLPYEQFIAVLRRATLALTDSGGIQEEAPTFGVPTLVMRKVTERPEAVEAGLARLVGTTHDTIVSEVERLLTDPACFDRMARRANPFGDGRAADRIANAVCRFLSDESPVLQNTEQFAPAA